MHARPLAAAAAALLVLGAASGCATSSSSASGSAASSASSIGALGVADPWVKAVGSGMTAAFGTLVNASTAPITVMSVTSPRAGRVEIHETVMKNGQMAMQPKQDGLTVPAGGSVVLAPGGNHLMLMDLVGPIEPGDQVPVMLMLADGSTVSFTATAKDYAGGNEPYHSASASASMSGMG